MFLILAIHLGSVLQLDSRDNRTSLRDRISPWLSRESSVLFCVTAIVEMLIKCDRPLSNLRQ